jgi:hypothetical protein
MQPTQSGLLFGLAAFEKGAIQRGVAKMAEVFAGNHGR